MLIGFGSFVNHHLLGIHHVNEIVSPAYLFYFDVTFLIWGALMLILGYILLGQGCDAQSDGANDKTHS